MNPFFEKKHGILNYKQIWRVSEGGLSHPLYYRKGGGAMEYILCFTLLVMIIINRKFVAGRLLRTTSCGRRKKITALLRKS